MALKEPGLRGSLRNTGSVTPAFFDVTITNTNSPVQEGDILTVDYSADNTGDAQDMQDIRLEIDSVQEDVDLDVMLSGGASTTGTLEWDTTGELEAEYTATVLSDDDTDSVMVEIGSAIPDLGLDHFYWSKELSSIDPWPDESGDLDASIVGSPTLITDGFNSKQTIEYSQSGDRHEVQGVFDLNNEQEFTAVAVVKLDDLTGIRRFGITSGDGGFRWGVQDGAYEFNLFGGDGSVDVTSPDTDPHVHVITYFDGNLIWDVDGDNIYNASEGAADDPGDGFAIFGQQGFDDGSLGGQAGAYGHESAPADSERRDELTETLGDEFGISTST